MNMTVEFKIRQFCYGQEDLSAHNDRIVQDLYNCFILTPNVSKYLNGDIAHPQNQAGTMLSVPQVAGLPEQIRACHPHVPNSPHVLMTHLPLTWSVSCHQQPRFPSSPKVHFKIFSSEKRNRKYFLRA
jgi:hypothetical protein